MFRDQERYGRDPSVVVRAGEHTFGDYSYGRWGWMLADPIAFDAPVICNGGRRLWDLPPDIHERVRVAYGEAFGRRVRALGER